MPLVKVLPLTSLVLTLLWAGTAVSQTPIPTDIPAGVMVETDLLYARYADKSLFLDLYRPADTDDFLPVVVLLHGGGRAEGRKERFGPLAAAFAQRGLAAVSIDYRGTGSDPFPATVHDAKAAVRWVRANAQRYHLNPRGIGLFGGSYGAYIAVFSGLTSGDSRYEGRGGNEEYSSAVQAMAGFSTLADLPAMPVALGGFLENMLGGTLEEGQDVWREASPVSHVGRSSVPLLLVASRTDNTVPYTQSVSLAERYADAGREAEIHLLDKAHHAFWNYTEWSGEAMAVAARFFLAHLAEE